MCGCNGGGGGGVIAGAIGPEVAQAAGARRNARTTLMAGAQGQGEPGVGDWEGDSRPVHHSGDGVRLAHLVDPDAVDVSTGWQLLPGRVIPPTVWDGEPGPLAPQ